MKLPPRKNNGGSSDNHGDDQFIRACKLAIAKIPVTDRNDGSRRMVMVARQCKRFGLTKSQSFCVIREYEEEKPFPGSPVPDKDIERRLKEANVIHGEACEDGYKPRSTPRWEEVDPHTGEDLPKPEPPEPVTDFQRLEAEYLLLCDQCGGFLRAYSDYYLKHAVKPQPPYALGGGLALISALVGRKIRTTYKCNPNLQCVMLGETGMGKEYARQLNNKILGEVSAWDLMGAERYASDKALMKELIDQPALLLQIDEFGRILASAQKSNSSHESNFITLLLKLFEGANNQRFRHGRSAGDETRQVIDRPWVTVLGTGTPKGMFSGMTEDMIFDGLLNRCLVIEATTERRIQIVQETPLPSEIIAFSSHWWRQDPDDPVEVKLHPDAMARLVNLDETNFQMLRRSNSHRALLVRQPLKVRQIATLKALSEAEVSQFTFSDQAIEVSEQDVSWAIHLVTNADKVLADRVERGFSVNKQHALANRLLEIVRAEGKHGIARNLLTRKTHWLTHSQRDELLFDLLVGGLIVEKKIETSKRPVTKYFDLPYG